MSHDFVALVLPHRKELLTYAMRLCKSKAMAEDVVQEVLLKAMESWERFYVAAGMTPESAARAWLYTITHNQFVSTWRKIQKDKLLHEEARHEEQQREVSLGPDADPRLSIEGYSAEVEEALVTLDPKWRKVVVLATRGLTYKEIAAELGLPIGTVMSSLCRARRQLELQLAGYAASEYGLRRAGKDADAVQSTERPEPEATSINSVVAALADLALGR